MKKNITYATATLVIIAVGAPNFALAKATDYKATIQIRKPGEGKEKIKGFVFEDNNRDGIFNQGDFGIPNVMVSNGKEVVLTNPDGKYKFKKEDYRDDMNIFVTKPACYELPVDENNVPQFSYVHKKNGSSKELVFGGLTPTGMLPKKINFPLIKGECKEKFTIAVSGDPQPYSNIEVGYVRDTLAKELADRKDIEAIIIEGDVMGDDLGLMPRFLNNLSAANAPQYLVVGNHDLDFDADTDADSSDTFRNVWGPNYYSFSIGKVHFVTLDNTTYPCNAVDTEGNADERWSFCEAEKTYNGRVPDIQLEWLENDLKHVPKDHLIVLNYHIPTVSFIDQFAYKHSEDQAKRIYEILGYTLENGKWSQGRPALAFSGHTHTNEQFRPGEIFEGWKDTSHNFPMPFPQIIAGAAAGAWWSGDLDSNLIPESYQRLGAPKGYFLINFDGNTYQDEFKASGKSNEQQMSLSFNSPDFRDWFTVLSDWTIDKNKEKSEIPPVSVNNLGDNNMLRPDDLAETKLVINLWNGSRDSEVMVSFDNKDPIAAERTQRGEGEGQLETLDPFALRRQLSVLRYALKSTETDENEIWNGELGDRSDGFELFNATVFKADSQAVMPSWTWADQSNHIWTIPVPSDLTEGVHRALVQTTDVHGKKHKGSLLFEVRTPNSLTDPRDNDPTDEKYDRLIVIDREL